MTVTVWEAQQDYWFRHVGISFFDSQAFCGSQQPLLLVPSILILSCIDDFLSIRESGTRTRINTVVINFQTNWDKIIIEINHNFPAILVKLRFWTFMSSSQILLKTKCELIFFIMAHCQYYILTACTVHTLVQYSGFVVPAVRWCCPPLHLHHLHSERFLKTTVFLVQQSL